MPTANILILGDSLSLGADGDTSSFRTYRGTLQNFLSAAGVDFDFVGSQILTPVAGGSDPHVAAWGGACIDSTGSASNNLTDRLSSLKTDYPSLDLLIIYAGWNDVYNAPSSLASRYATFISAVRSGAWASVKAILCTLHPQRGETEAQTGSSISAYAALNTQIRSMASSSLIIADLASRVGGNASALLESAIYDAQHANDVSTTMGGSTLPASFGGHEAPSFAAIAAFNNQWSTTPPNPGVGGEGNSDSVGPSSYGAGHPGFRDNVRYIVPWLWMYAAPGHAATNSCLEARNLFGMAMRTSNSAWGSFFAGARFGTPKLWGPSESSLTYGQRSDGLTSYFKPHNSTGLEAWPGDTIPSRGIVEFYGGANRDLMADARVFFVGCQVRVAQLDPGGVDDRTSARFVAKCGFDLYRETVYPRYDYLGFPYTAMDGGSDRWKSITSSEWVWVTSLSLGSGSDGHYFDPGLMPPLGFFSAATPYNDIASGYAVNAATVRSNPPPLPNYYSGTTAGYSTVDYWDVIHLYQSGADKLAETIAQSIILSGVLSTFTTTPGGGSGGGDPVIPPFVLPGIATRPNFVDKLTSTKKTWTFKNHSSGGDGNIDTAPAWLTTSMPVAVIGTAYSGGLAATGVPAPTYSHVSGKPAWLSVNSSTGALTGTPTGSETSHTITWRASNASGDVDLIVTLVVSAAVTITTTTLPNAIQNVAYQESIAANGAQPFTWSVSTGSLPTGMSFAGGVVSGTPTASSGTSNFTLQVIDATGASDTQALSITVGTASQKPVVTTTTLTAGTVGSAYSQSVSATGSGVTFAVVSGSLPAGVSLNSGTGVLTGTPTIAGTYGFTVRATNAYGYDDGSLSLTIQSSATQAVASPWGRFL